MKYSVRTLLLLSLCTTYTIQASILDTVKSFWATNKEIISKEQILTPNSTFRIENTRGNISIKTWKQNKFVLEAVKKGSPEAVAATDISTKYTENGATVKTVQADSQTKCTVDYTILIPLTTTVTLAHTDHGNITIKNTEQPAKAQTYKGSIICQNVTNSIHANTRSGNIKIHAKKLDKNHKILAVSGRGNIKLELPPKTPASLYAKAQKGKVSSDHPVVLAQRPMQITQKTMASLRRDIQGKIGSIEGVTIKLHTSSGNVRLVEA
ncbi:MAG: hypothetical protein ACJAZS_000100 [Alteromonas naphthalenivorans]|jgi:hypothetical protein